MTVTATYDPEQWQLVPIEPSLVMIVAGNLVNTPQSISAYEAYKTMLSAAPRHESGQTRQERIPDLESRDFYEVMQAYRHEPLDAHKQFEAVKAWLRNPTYPYEHPDTLKVPRPEGHDSWSIEIKTAFGGGGGGGVGAKVGNYVGGGGGGSYPDTGETTDRAHFGASAISSPEYLAAQNAANNRLREMMEKANTLSELPYRKMEHIRDNGDGTLTINRPIPYKSQGDAFAGERERCALIADAESAKMKITRVCEHPRTSIVWDEAYRRCDDCNASVPAEG